jgi:uncharacterized alkaline shock family protein YloU
MKTHDKLLIVFNSLVLIAIAVFIMAVSVDPGLLEIVLISLSSNTGRIIGVAAGFILLILGFKTIISSFSKKLPTLASIQTTDLGVVNITVTALEHLVSKAAKQIKEVKEIKPRVKPLNNGVAVFLNAGVSTESNLPIVTKELQDTVKEYIEQIAGIDVLEVKILVNYITQENKLRVE